MKQNNDRIVMVLDIPSLVLRYEDHSLLLYRLLLQFILAFGVAAGTATLLRRI